MAISTPFSSQNTTIEIFNDAVATATLTSAIATALAGSNKQADLKTAYDAFFTSVATVTATAVITVTGALTTAPAQVDGYYTGVFAIGSVTGTWSSTSVSSSTTINAVLTPLVGMFTASQTSQAITTCSVTGTHQPSTPTTASGVYTSSAASAAKGFLVGKVTAMGDTGKTYAGISAKLINESGTMKAKGSSDEGDFTVDFLNTPGDAGQTAMTDAFNDETANANRVFRIVHGSSGDGTNANSEMVYFVGMVTELKKTRGAVDNYVSVKSKISIQNGLYEYNPA